MGSKIFIVLFFIISCNEIFCRFNKVPDPPYPNPDNVDNYKTSIINQVTYVYNCLENDTYSKQFVAFTYIFERSILDPDDDSACWQETVYVSLGIC